MRQKQYRRWMIHFLFLFMTCIWNEGSKKQFLFAEAKVSKGSIKLSGAKSEQVLTSLAISAKGVGKLSVTFHGRSPYKSGDDSSLQLSMYNAKDWPKVKRAPTCAEKVKYSIANIPIKFTLQRYPPWDLRKEYPGERRNKKGESGLWTSVVGTTVNNAEYDTPKYYYVMVNDCSLEEYLQDDTVKVVNFKAIMQDDASPGSKRQMLSHFSADEKGLIYVHLITFCLSAFLGFLLFVRMVRNLGVTGSVHFALVMVYGACCFDAASAFCAIAHWIVYYSNGVGLYFMDAFAAHFEAICDSIVAIILLSVGSGWTLPSDVLSPETNNVLVDGLRNPMGSLLEFGPAGILSLSIFLIHAALAQWGRTYDDDFDTYHSLEHFSGRVLMIFRFILGMAFLIGVASVRNSGRCPASLVPFLNKFALVGVAWFVSLPFVSTFVASVVPNHRKHQLLAFGTALVQSSSLLSLSWLFAGHTDSSVYHRLSRASASGGAGGGASMTGEGRAGMNLTDALGGYGGNSSTTGVRRRPKVWSLGKAKIRLD